MVLTSSCTIRPRCACCAAVVSVHRLLWPGRRSGSAVVRSCIGRCLAAGRPARRPACSACAAAPSPSCACATTAPGRAACARISGLGLLRRLHRLPTLLLNVCHSIFRVKVKFRGSVSFRVSQERESDWFLRYSTLRNRSSAQSHAQESRNVDGRRAETGNRRRSGRRCYVNKEILCPPAGFPPPALRTHSHLD